MDVLRVDVRTVLHEGQHGVGIVGVKSTVKGRLAVAIFASRLPPPRQAHRWLRPYRSEQLERGRLNGGLCEGCVFRLGLETSFTSAPCPIKALSISTCPQQTALSVADSPQGPHLSIISAPAASRASEAQSFDCLLN